ncbi:MAG TPA: ParB/RepB/Spo0J family partition protein [Thermodesulfobacteriota bacterium]|nr:ParB/RepB/Spo0J family partition protein [Thermodesulfobacteriota bacterium]
MNKKTTLGKGLNALFPDIGAVMEEEGKTELSTLLDIEAIHPNPYQPRKFFNPETIEELAASLRSSGIIQPLVVRKGSDGYELIAGERRWRAAIKAGLKQVPVIIKDVSDDQVLKLSLIENLQRENLNPIEEAEVYYRLIEDFKLLQETVGEVVGKNRSTITNTLRLLKLPEEIKKDLSLGKISPGHARAILVLDNDSQRLTLHQKIIKQELSVRQTEELVKHWKAGKSLPTPRKESVEIKSIRENLQRTLGTQVKIFRKGKRGRIEILFFSDDDLERILEIIYGGK